MNLAFPRLVYKDGGKYQRLGGTYNYLGVQNEEEYSAKLADGWHDSLELAIAPKAVSPIEPIVSQKEPVLSHATPVSVTSSLRSTLEQQARDLKLRFHPSISDDNLLKKIDRAIFEQNAYKSPES